MKKDYKPTKEEKKIYFKIKKDFYKVLNYKIKHPRCICLGCMIGEFKHGK